MKIALRVGLKSIAHSFPKHCPSFWKTLPVIFSNIADDFLFRCPSFSQAMGNVFSKAYCSLTGIFDSVFFFSLHLNCHISPVSVSNSNQTQLLSVGYSSKRPGILSSTRGSALSTRFFCGFDGKTARIVPSLVSSLRKTPVIAG